MQLVASQDFNWWTGVLWITWELLWCFYHLFGLSFWRHPFTSIGEQVMEFYISPNLRKNQTHRHLRWLEGDDIQSIFIPLIHILFAISRHRALVNYYKHQHHQQMSVLHLLLSTFQRWLSKLKSKLRKCFQGGKVDHSNETPLRQRSLNWKDGETVLQAVTMESSRKKRHQSLSLFLQTSVLTHTHHGLQYVF